MGNRLVQYTGDRLSQETVRQGIKPIQGRQFREQGKLSVNVSGMTDFSEQGQQKNLEFLPIDPTGWYHGNTRSKKPYGLGIVCYSENRSDRGQFRVQNNMGIYV